jgi:hypothetical protein
MTRSAIRDPGPGIRDPDRRARRALGDPSIRRSAEAGSLKPEARSLNSL